MAKPNDSKIAIVLDDLASLESYIRDLFTFSPLPICFISPLGVVLEFNPAFEQLSGYKFYEIIGEGIEKIFPAEMIKQFMDEAAIKKDVLAREMRLTDKEGEARLANIFGRARKDQAGLLIGFFIGAFDLTEIKKAGVVLEEKIEELEKFQKIAVGRELKMAGLKEEIKRLKGQSTNQLSEDQ